MKQYTEEFMTEFKEWFNYDSESGLFTFKKVKPKNRVKKVGDIAGGICARDGYVLIRFNGKVHYGHRLAWAWVNGELPECIDHINQVRTDNRIENLRNVTYADNNKNRLKSTRNSSGVVGVYMDKDTGRWKARISVDGKEVFLGSFAEFSSAVNARKNAEVLYNYHENHGRDKGDR